MRTAGGILTIIGGIIGTLFSIGELYSILGIVALIGGIFALRTRVWGFALAGGIAAIGIGAVLSNVLPGLGGLWGYIVLMFGIPGATLIALKKENLNRPLGQWCLIKLQAILKCN